MRGEFRSDTMTLKLVDKSEVIPTKNIELYEFQKEIIRKWLATGNIGVITWRSNL